VRNAIARFDQVEGVRDAEQEWAWKRILAAAKHYGVEVSAASWRAWPADRKLARRPQAAAVRLSSERLGQATIKEDP
jgi:hypothetical protein